MVKTLPLGIDIGETAIRIALLESENGVVRIARIIRCIATSSSVEDVGHALRSSLNEADVREKRCIAVLQDPDAVLRTLSLPPMSSREADAYVKLEADRLYGEGNGYAKRVASSDKETHIVGFAKRDAMTRVQNIARAARLQLQAIDYAGFAYKRLFPTADAIIDIGHNATRYCSLASVVPWSTSFEGGGAQLSAAIARAFALDHDTAEKRKIERGLLIGAEFEMDTLVEHIGRAMRTARVNGALATASIVMVGNGARAQDLLERIERETGCIVERAIRQPFGAGIYSDDVVSASLPDWALALGAASWTMAGAA
jgi:Tfp pilus assembly PilM family ATPase